MSIINEIAPVYAVEFGTPDSFEEIFSSGEEDSCITDTENTLPAASDSEKVMASELSPTPTVTSTPEGTPALTETPTPSVTPMPSSTPTPSVTPSPSPTPTINPEKEVMLRFIDGEGNECEQLRTVMSWGESLILPNVPDTGAPDMWKLEKNGSTLESMNGLGLQAEAEGSEQIPFSSEVLEINVDELAQWIFGYRPLEEILTVAPPFWTEYVRTLQGVFLDEVV